MSPIAQNFLTHIAALPTKAKNMQVFADEAITYIDSGLSCDTFNVLFINNGQFLTEKNFSTALRYYQDQQLDFCVWLEEPEMKSNVKYLFEKYRLKYHGEEVGMSLHLNRYNLQSNDKHSNIKIVQTEEQLRLYAQVMAANWTPPDQNVIEFYNQTSSLLLDPEDPIDLYLYYLDGNAVGTLELIPSDDQKTIGIYNVATLANFRGRGIASALMSFALNQAKQSGYETVVLQASADGLNVYKRQGFEAQHRFFEFAL